MRRRGFVRSDQRLLVLNLLTTSTILVIGTAAGGIALIPYLQGHGEFTLAGFQRLTVLGLLFVSSLSYLSVIASATPAFLMIGERQNARLNMATAFLAIQATTSGGVLLVVFWSLLIGNYTEGTTANGRWLQSVNQVGF